jgi:hypothetical protein
VDEEDGQQYSPDEGQVKLVKPQIAPQKPKTKGQPDYSSEDALLILLHQGNASEDEEQGPVGTDQGSEGNLSHAQIIEQPESSDYYKRSSQ